MARTQEELRARLAYPHWMREVGEIAEAIAQALAAEYALVEGALETLHERTFTETADGSWLDEHGRERRVQRRQDESDEDFRVRVRALPDVVTPNAVKAAVDSVLLEGESRVEEHLHDMCFANVGFANHAFAYRGDRAFTVYVPLQLPSRSDSFASSAVGPAPAWRAFATADGDVPGELGAFADTDVPTGGQVYARIIDEIERTRAGGVAYRVVVEA